MFLQVCVCPQGGHTWRGEGCAWQGVCMVGGMCGRGCMAGGMHGRGACVAGGMHGTGACVVRGACMVGGMHGGEEGHAWCGKYYGIQSMSGQYASYWNAFLLSE